MLTNREYDMTQIRKVLWILVLAVSWFVLFPFSIGAETAEQGAVHLDGDLMFRGDHYEVEGDGRNAPYPFTGTHRYLDFNLELQRAVGEYENWHLRLGGVANDSRYRSSDRGAELERLRFTWEKGDAGTPFRFEAGEIYGNFTNRTLQRALRGFLLDLQPVTRGSTRRSIQFLWGLARGDWKDPFTDRDQSVGLSVLEEHRDDLRLSLNWVANRRDSTTLRSALSQQVFSLAFEKPLDVQHRHSLESEYAWFRGDHEGDGTPGSGSGKTDTGLFLQLRGQTNPFGYTWRFEEYGRDFRPVGANITQNRRALEGYLSWQLEKIRTLSFRMQRYRNGWESLNPVDSDTVGVSLNGQVSPHDKLYLSLNAYVDRADDHLDTVDSRSRTIDLNLSRPLRPNLNGRLGFAYRDFDNHLGATGDNRALQTVVGFDQSLLCHGAPLTIGVNLVRNRVDSSGIVSKDWSSGLTVYRTAGNQEFGLTWNAQALDYQPTANADVFANDLGFRWQRRNGDTVFGVELSRNRRDETRAWRYAFYLGTEFAETLTRGRRRPKDETSATTGTTEAFEVTRVQIGASATELLERLKQSGIVMTRLGRLSTADYPVYQDLFERQTLAIEEDNQNRIVRAGAVVRLEDFASSADIMDVYNRVRRRLLERLGNPTNSYERGAIGPTLADDIRSGAFVRVLDWQTPNGMVRLGFPRRLDGRLRLEVQVAASFPRETEGLWGFENVN